MTGVSCFATQALMLAAAVDSVEAVAILLENGATVELQVPFLARLPAGVTALHIQAP